MNSLLVLSLSINSLFLTSTINAIRLQGVGVQGRLFCGGKPLRNTRVRIYDVDRCNILPPVNYPRTQYICKSINFFCCKKNQNYISVPGDRDDLLDEGFTDANGEFRLEGSTRELTSIEPRLIIYHNCNDGIKPCERHVYFDIPKKYIHSGRVQNWYDIGELNMKNTFPNEGRSCDYEES